MTDRAVYGAMIYFQWATLPPDQPHRQHTTVDAVVRGAVRLCFSPALLAEVQALLSRDELRLKYKSLTPLHVKNILDRARRLADWYESVPARFSLRDHPKDDHLFNLAIEAHARYLVTWENRLLKLQDSRSAEAMRLRDLAPDLVIVSPQAFTERFKIRRGE